MTGMDSAFPLVIAAPSGTGKTTLARALVDRHDDIVFSISVTTREPRPREEGGKDYRFVDDAEFVRMIEDHELLEWAVVHGYRYGTPRKGITDALAEDDVVVLDIDVQGARQIRRTFPEAVLVFILPPSANELNRRLTGRGSEQEAERIRRLEGARRELGFAADFDYVVVNDEFQRAMRSLECIIEAERKNVARAKRLGDELQRLDKELGIILEKEA